MSIESRPNDTIPHPTPADAAASGGASEPRSAAALAPAQAALAFWSAMCRQGAQGLAAVGRAGVHLAAGVRARALPLTVTAAGVALVVACYHRPPWVELPEGEALLRTQRWSGQVEVFDHGMVWVLPGVHRVRTLTLRDQLYSPAGASGAQDKAAFQSVEGLTLGVELHVRWAVDPKHLASHGPAWPDALDEQLVQPAVQGVIYKTLARYTVREIFSNKRADIQAQIEQELAPKLAADGLVLRSVQIGKVDLPSDYRRGLESLLSEGLASEKMRYTLALKEQQVRETELAAEAERVRREKTAEAAAREQIIAARAQEEAMRHILPFKQKQIEQRQLEAEADKVARIRGAEGSAQARRIETQGEADARQKLADAEAYRLNKVGQANAEQMAREGALVSRHPLLIQKTLADKLGDKVQVIIAPPPANGDFIGASLLGGMNRTAAAAPAVGAADQPTQEATQ